MEVKIGVSDSPRELVVSSEQTPDEVEALVTDALSGGDGSCRCTDDKGRKFLMQASKVAYVEIGPSDSRKVGFAPTKLNTRDRARSRLDCGPFLVSRCQRVRCCSGTWDRPPHASATVVSTASSLGIGRSASSQ